MVPPPTMHDSFRIATWNVNSIRVRLPHLLRWLGETSPDVVLLQELKCTEEQFPYLDLEAAGYHAVCVGQKSYNGVAILSRQPINVTERALPDDPSDTQARYLEAEIAGLRIASLYLPNGNPAPGDKYAYKLAWMRRLYRHARTLLQQGGPIILGGDFNVCPTDHDVYDPSGWRDDALCRSETRQAFRSLLHLGYWDALRLLHPDETLYSFWDYQAGAWPKNNGLRIDHFLVSSAAVDRLAGCAVDRSPRGWEQPSDHTPVILTLT